jgi:ABC-type branched-subunit amino acid transport system ATPase component/branched-subunit amino acid ABC-type transport system permease component
VPSTRRIDAIASSLTSTFRRRMASVAGAAIVGYVIGALLLPKGLPVEVIIPGLITGGLSSLTAMGLVLIFRSTRIINFAQANMGGIVATLVVLLVEVTHWNYWAAVGTGLLVAVVLGAQIEKAFIANFSKAPRLIVTVVTIGIAQLLAAGTIFLQHAFNRNGRIGSIVPFHSPVGGRLSVGTLLLTGDHFIAIAAIPLVLAGLAWFLTRTDAGIGARAAADSSERAQLLGIPVRRLSMLTWAIASVMSAMGAILSAGVQGFHSNLLAGPESLVVPLAAAVVAGFDSLPVAFVASLGISITQQAIFWSYPQSSVVDLVIFAIILLALLVRHRRTTQVDREDLGAFAALSEPRPLPKQVLRLPEVRAARVGTLAVAIGACAVLPLWFNESQLTFFAFTSIFVIVAASLVVLTGWGGQVSLGQFAFVGLGAGTTGWLLTTYHASLLACLFASTLVGIVAALVIGIPALRIRGLYLAAVTLAFAVPASTFFLSSLHFPAFTPERVDPPILFSRFDLSRARPFYYFCLIFAFIALGIARNFRASRVGRAAIAVRDNDRMAEAVAISATKTRLVTFAVAGALAGFAGGLYVLAYRGVPFNGFSPVLGLEAFTMIVVGGMSSLWGAVLGALYVYVSQYFLGATAQLVVTGGGIIAILQFAPGGLAHLTYQIRDLVLRSALRRRGLSPNLLYSRDDEQTTTAPGFRKRFAAATARVRKRQRRRNRGRAPFPSLPGPLLACHQVEASYGHLQVLFGVDAEVNEGEIFALLGTNGAGKSTILKVIAGVLELNSGQITVKGEDIDSLTPADRVRRGIVLVPGGRGVFGSLTVKENLRLAGWLARRDGDDAFLEGTMEKIFELFPVLRARQSQKASLLSGGEQQMLTIAQGLLCRPKLLMIDELSLGLAPIVVAELLGVLRSLNQSGITVLLVEQSLNIAASAAPRAAFLEKGQVRFLGATKELTGSDGLARSVFFSGARDLQTAKSDGKRVRRLPPAMRTTPVLQVSGVRKSFGGVLALVDVDLAVYEGEILGVIGANGAGKTTLFNIISGFVRPDGGRLVLQGHDVTGTAASGRAALGLGRTFQDLRLIPSMTVAEVVALALERRVEVREPVASVLGLAAVRRSEAAVMHEVDELLATFNLDRFRNSFISELSTGTRRVVEFACVLAHRPSVLILDEPSSGLAQREAEAMAELILDIKERTGAAIAIVEHDIPLIKHLSDELVCMHLGEVIARGAPDAVLSDEKVAACYLGFDADGGGTSGSVARRAGRGRSKPAAVKLRSRPQRADK